MSSKGGRLQVVVAKVQIQTKPCFWWWEAARHPQSPNRPSMAKSICWDASPQAIPTTTRKPQFLPNFHATTWLQQPGSSTASARQGDGKAMQRGFFLIFFIFFLVVPGHITGRCVCSAKPPVSCFTNGTSLQVLAGAVR